MDKLNAMHIFIRVAQAGSLIAVADQMQVDRSVITRQIGALEKQLGVKLLTRSTRRLSLTTAGSAYLEKCRVIMNLIDAAESSLSQDKAEPKGPIRLGLPLSFGLQQLMPALLEFTQRYPSIDMRLDFSDRQTNLIEEGLDLSIRITSEPAPTMIARKLGDCQLLTLASGRYLAQHGEPKHPQELTYHECLIYENSQRTSHWSYWVDGQLQSYALRGRMRANNGVALTQAAAASLGITRQPDFIARPFVVRGEVREILKNYPSLPLGIYAVLPSQRYIPHRVSVLMDELASFIQTKG